MNINPFFQEYEEYYCTECEKKIVNLEYNKNGKCPECGQLIIIKLKIDNSYHSCHRINPDELEVGDIMILRNNSHIVLNIQKNINQYRISLKEYGVITVENDSIITRIFGGWFY